MLKENSSVLHNVTFPIFDDTNMHVLHEYKSANHIPACQVNFEDAKSIFHIIADVQTVVVPTRSQ